MTFASFTSPPPNDVATGNFASKVAEIIVFPQITGRDAPGKTGNSAKPALLRSMGIGIGTVAPVEMILFLVNSDGNRIFQFSTDPFVLEAFDTELKNASFNKPRPVFSGTEYYLGFADTGRTKPDGNTPYRWGIASGPQKARLDKTYLGDNNRFLNQGPAGPGSLYYGLYYNVLPTAPLALTGVISGPTDTNVDLAWNAVASDGGEPVDGYKVQISTDNLNWSNLNEDTKNTGRTYPVTNLIPGVTYFFRVAALNLVSYFAGPDYSGPYSNVFSITIPGATAGNAQSVVTVTVTDPEPNSVRFSDFGEGIRFKSIDVQYGSEFLYNEIQATTQDSFAETQILDSVLSKQLYGTRTYSLTNLLSANDEEALAVARDYLSYYFQPQNRVQSILVDLFTLTIEEKLQVLGLEIDDFISISFTPNGIGEPKIANGLVTGISHRVSITSHEVELRLRNQLPSFTLNSDRNGILDVNILGP